MSWVRFGTGATVAAIGEQDVHDTIEALRERGPHIVALSGHDSTTWTYGAMERAFGDGYRTLRVGEELEIAGSS